jgi:hypothetical protein
MSVSDLRQAAKQSIENLPAPKLRVATEFLAFLEYGATDAATVELLKIPGLLKDLKKARRDYSAGKNVNWRKVRKDV